MKEKAEFGFTRVSSKGQIVIPASLRKKLGVKTGSMLAIGARKGLLVLKSVDAKLKPEDLKTIRLIEEAWKDIERGRFKTYSKRAFLREMKKW